MLVRLTDSINNIFRFFPVIGVHSHSWPTEKVKLNCKWMSTLTMSIFLSPFPFSPHSHECFLFQCWHVSNGSIYLFLLSGAHFLRSYYSQYQKWPWKYYLHCPFWITHSTFSIFSHTVYSTTLTSNIFPIEHWLVEKLLSYISLIPQSLCYMNDYALSTVYSET